jgi:hypothetical protein
MGEPLCGDPDQNGAASDIAELASKLVPAVSSDKDPEVAVPARRSGRLRFFGKG